MANLSGKPEQLCEWMNRVPIQEILGEEFPKELHSSGSLLVKHFHQETPVEVVTSISKGIRHKFSGADTR